MAIVAMACEGMRLDGTQLLCSQNKVGNSPLEVSHSTPHLPTPHPALHYIRGN